MELSDSEADLDRFSAAQSPQLVVTRVDTNSEEEEEMTLNSRRSLRDLVIGRKGGPSKDIPKTQLPPNPTLPPLPSPLGLFPDPNLQKRKRKEKRLRKGSLLHRKTQNSKKRIKKDRGRLQWRAGRILWGLRCADHSVLSPLGQSWMALPSPGMPWSRTSRGHSNYVAEAFEQPLLLPKDMDAYRRFKQPDLFLSLKRDLAMVSDST